MISSRFAQDVFQPKLTTKQWNEAWKPVRELFDAHKFDEARAAAKWNPYMLAKLNRMIDARFPQSKSKVKPQPEPPPRLCYLIEDVEEGRAQEAFDRARPYPELYDKLHKIIFDPKRKSIGEKHRILTLPKSDEKKLHENSDVDSQTDESYYESGLPSSSVSDLLDNADAFPTEKLPWKQINHLTKKQYRQLIVKLAGTQAPQTYNDMGTTTKNVRQWTVEDIPLESLSDKNIPVKKLHTKLP